MLVAVATECITLSVMIDRLGNSASSEPMRCGARTNRVDVDDGNVEVGVCTGGVGKMGTGGVGAMVTGGFGVEIGVVEVGDALTVRDAVVVTWLSWAVS